MYLEKLEIQGFKSFANKNKLIFPGLVDKKKRGLTSIVGPNGSGKSNVTDAIRWALGEQSIKTLRGKRSEDVIFSGSDQRSRLGMAEVSLYLNNHERVGNRGKEIERIEKESDLDQVLSSCADISITRRLYRSGESEYLLNGNRIRLSDIQLLLAKANFGQKTYSVIGQGMVENFLNTSAAERKDFFDEATGVKQFQIKRDASLNKLESSYENLQQVEMLLTEISPRLRSLTRQIDKLNKRSQIEIGLKTNQLDYYYQIWEDISSKLDQFNNHHLEREGVKFEKDKKLTKLTEELNKLRNTDSYQEINNLKPSLQRLYDTRNQLHKQLAKIQAEFEINLESQGQFDLSWLNNKQVELTVELGKVDQELNIFTDTSHNTQSQKLENDLTNINKQLALINKELQEINQTVSVSQNQEQSREEISRVISEFLRELELIEEENSLEEIKKTIRKTRDIFKNKIEGLISTNNSEKLEKVKKIQEEIISLNERKQELLAEINNQRFKLSGQNERQKLLEEKRDKLKLDLTDIDNKINKQSIPQELKKISQDKTQLEDKVKEVSQEIKVFEEKERKLNKAKEEEKSLIFDYQRNLQNLQNEINIFITEINDLKIKATRQETRLEDLEINIRNDKLNLKEIKDHQPTTNNLNLEDIQKKIISQKSQLEMIGGIDPETEKEYQETKERFDFLSTQTNDLNKAIKSLEQIVCELDINIKGRFDKEFKIISEKFNDYFKILFSGGRAKISKIMLEDIVRERKEGKEKEETGQYFEEKEKIETSEQLNNIKFLKKHSSVGLAGIDVQAVPPGKKIQSVNMLSGGERALTAIALICAIISANPSPFVVLDEVDAALDEANTERLVKILDDLSNKTQFIIVTHNRTTMRQADVLYGVTMESDGVSKLLSVKLEEAKQYD